MYKTRIRRRVRSLADQFGVTIRIADTPLDANIMIPKDENKVFKKISAAYFGEGVIFLKSKTKNTPDEMEFIFLHELGHAILDFYFKKLNPIAEEVMANGIATGFVAYLKTPISKKILKNCIDFAKFFETNKPPKNLKTK